MREFRVYGVKVGEPEDAWPEVKDSPIAAGSAQEAAERIWELRDAYIRDRPSGVVRDMLAVVDLLGDESLTFWRRSTAEQVRLP